jgi:hypothetical protein
MAPQAELVLLDTNIILVYAMNTYDERFAKMPGIVVLTPNPAG